MAWRIAKSLLKLREQINTALPDRLRISDGGIGDAAHTSRNSDHNPWVRDSKGQPIVTAIDLTHDPDFNGLDCNKLAEALRKSADPRIKYLIWNCQITTRMSGGGFGWKKYNGSNPHTKHLHISVVDREFLFDSDSPWNIAAALTPNRYEQSSPLRDLKSGDQGADVQSLQKRLIEIGFLKSGEADGYFGARTKNAVMFFQRDHGLRADGIVGENTCRALSSIVVKDENILEIPTISAASPSSTGNLALTPAVAPATDSATLPPNPPIEMEEGTQPKESDDKLPTGKQEICKERPSTFVRIGALITGGVGTATAFGMNIGALVQNKLEQLTPAQIFYTLMGLAFVALAIWFYDRSAKRANALNQTKLAIAGNPDLITTELNANKKVKKQ